MTRPARNVLKEALWEEHDQHCMAFYFIRHRCLPAPDLHEVFFTKDDARKSHKAYITDRLNCFTVCSPIHMAYGQTAWFRACAAHVLVALYGEEAVAYYLSTSPWKTKPPNLQAILDFPEPWRTVDSYRWIQPKRIVHI